LRVMRIAALVFTVLAAPDTNDLAAR
jgi:hypothetical protein